MPLAAWIAAGGNRIKVIETDWGSVLQENIALRQALSAEGNLRIPPARRLRNAGENAILEFANTIRPTLTPDTTGLVLFEDRRVELMDFGPHVRRMTTWSFALVLQSLGVIPSADKLFPAIPAPGAWWTGKSSTGLAPEQLMTLPKL